MSRTYEDDVAPAQYLQETGASDVKFARMMLPHTASLWQSLDDNTVCCKQTCVRVRLRLCVCVCVVANRTWKSSTLAFASPTHIQMPIVATSMLEAQPSFRK